jgi:hypothetical protein
LVGADNFTGALDWVTGEDVGSYQITQGDLAIDNSDSGRPHNLTYVPDDFTITERTSPSLPIRPDQDLR